MTNREPCLNTNFANTARELRIAAGMTVSNLAAELGCSTGYVNNVEAGRAPPYSREKVLAFARALSGETYVDGISLADYADESRHPSRRRGRRAGTKNKDQVAVALVKLDNPFLWSVTVDGVRGTAYADGEGLVCLSESLFELPCRRSISAAISSTLEPK